MFLICQGGLRRSKHAVKMICPQLVFRPSVATENAKVGVLLIGNAVLTRWAVGA